MNAISKAINCLGSQDQLAKACDLTQAAISQYRTGAKRPSAETAIRIELATKGEVKADDLRPDIPWAEFRGTKAA